MIYSSTTSLTDPNNLWYAIQVYCESTEASFVAQIPEFVQLAEQRIYNTVQLPVSQSTTSSNVNFTAGSNIVTFPTDIKLLSILSFAIELPTGVYYLLNKDLNFIYESFPNPTVRGTPQYYALYPTVGSTTVRVRVGPTPDTTATGSVTYFSYPESITVSSGGTSWLGTNFDSVLLYGAIREAYTYLKGEQDLMAAYEQKYQEALMQLKVFAEGKARQDAYRSGQTRMDIP